MPTGFPDYFQGFIQPNYLYVGAADVLRVVAASSLANETVTVNYRQWNKDRTLTRGQFTVSPGATRALAHADQALTEGFLLSVSCKATQAKTRGQTFVRIFLTDTTLGLGQPGYMLMADYVTTAMAPSHPNGRVLAPSEGPGNIYLVLNAQPAKGADWFATVPTNARWRIRSINALLLASAAVANRQVDLAYTIGGSVVGHNSATVNITAAQSAAVSADPTPPETAIVASDVHIAIAPELTLLAGSVIASETTGLDANDQWGAQSIAVEEWLDNV